MSENNILEQLRVASPCSARWGDMSGDERARFCQHCCKHVFDLSAMTRTEAEALIREKEGKCCGRFYRRRDGRMLTADCRVGWRIRQWRLFKVCVALFAFVALARTGLFANSNRSDGSRGLFSQQVDGWIYDLKVRLGIVKPPMVMGAICIQPPPNPNPFRPAPTSAPNQ